MPRDMLGFANPRRRSVLPRDRPSYYRSYGLSDFVEEAGCFPIRSTSSKRSYDKYDAASSVDYEEPVENLTLTLLGASTRLPVKLLYDTPLQLALEYYAKQQGMDVAQFKLVVWGRGRVVRKGRSARDVSGLVLARRHGRGLTLARCRLACEMAIS